MEIRVQKTDQVLEFLTAQGWSNNGDCFEPLDHNIYVLDIPTKRFMSGSREPTLHYVPSDIFKEFTMLYVASYKAAYEYIQEYFND